MKTFMHVLIIILMVSVTWANELVVDQGGNGDFTTIQSAVVNARSNDTIFVKAGTYIEKLTISPDVIATPSIYENIIIVGEDRASVILVHSSDIVITISSFSLILSNMTIQSGIEVTYGGINLNNCLLDFSSKGIMRGRYGGNISATNCYFLVRSASHGIYTTHASSASERVTMINCLFNGGNVGVYRYGAASQDNLFIRNCIFTGMNDPISSGGTINIAYNSFYANSNSESDALFSVTSDYLIEDLSGGDYRLKSNSPLIDAGDPSSTYYDPDGSRNDIGLYGGPKSWGTAPTVTDLSVSPTSVDMGGSVTITATAKTN